MPTQAELQTLDLSNHTLTEIGYRSMNVKDKENTFLVFLGLFLKFSDGTVNPSTWFYPPEHGHKITWKPVNATVRYISMQIKLNEYTGFWLWDEFNNTIANEILNPNMTLTWCSQ